MARTWSLTRANANFDFVPAVKLEFLHQYNFEHYRNVIERKSAEDRRWYFESLFWRAIDHPNEPQYEYYSEFYSGTPNWGHEYEYVAVWRPETFTMLYNRTPCPNRTWHHLGQNCPVCGSE